MVPDDLRGYFENKNGERVREPGILESFNLSPEAAEDLILRARVVMGWIEAPPEEIVEEPEAVEDAAEADAAPEEGEPQDA